MKALRGWWDAIGVEVLAFGGGQWRVRDLRLPRGDARCLLGFIEGSAGGFEIVRLSVPHRRNSLVADLDAAVQLVCADRDR